MPAKPSTTPSFCVSVWNEDTHFAFNMSNLHFSTLNSIILIQMDNLFEYKLMPFNMLKNTHKKPSLNIYLYSVCVSLHAEWKYQIKYNAQLVYWNVCFLLLFFLCSCFVSSDSVHPDLTIIWSCVTTIKKTNFVAILVHKLFVIGHRYCDIKPYSTVKFGGFPVKIAQR